MGTYLPVLLQWRKSSLISVYRKDCVLRGKDWSICDTAILCSNVQVYQPQRPSLRRQRQGLGEWRTSRYRRRSGSRPSKEPEVAQVPLLGSVQGQAGWGFEQPGIVEGVPAHGRGRGTRWSLRSLPTQIIVWFCDCETVNHEVLRTKLNSRVIVLILQNHCQLWIITEMVCRLSTLLSESSFHIMHCICKRHKMF